MASTVELPTFHAGVEYRLMWCVPYSLVRCAQTQLTRLLVEMLPVDARLYHGLNLDRLAAVPGCCIAYSYYLWFCVADYTNE
jgi:hypothetical protein